MLDSILHRLAGSITTIIGQLRTHDAALQESVRTERLRISSTLDILRQQVEQAVVIALRDRTGGERNQGALSLASTAMMDLVARKCGHRLAASRPADADDHARIVKIGVAALERSADLLALEVCV